MKGQVKSIGLEGMQGYPVVAEANVREEKEACVIIGLPDAPMKESKERVLSCLHALDVDVSMKKITIHLSPADQRKTGTGHDCAMLVAVLQHVMDDLIPIATDTCFLAALSLTGNLMPFHGLIPAIQQALSLGFKRIIVPPINLDFLGKNPAAEFIPIHSLEELLSYLRGQQLLTSMNESILELHDQEETENDFNQTDFSSIRGHADAKRILEIAAAGGHHVLLNGPPGCGKTMLADAFHTIQPYLNQDEMLEVYSIYHLAKERRGFSKQPPYRHPHHSSSAVSLIGGGTFPKPGEISLAHRGTLFLDELGEFPKKALDMLRQPMETGEVTISRVKQTVQYPAVFTLIAATNPCPCGYFGSNERYCTCTPQQIRAYQLKASGPLLDRIDFILSLQSVGLKEAHQVENSAEIRTRTIFARRMQKQRYGNNALNGTTPFAMLLKFAGLSNKQSARLQQICFDEKWSNRTQTKLIRIARTIADLTGESSITDDAIDEAIKWKKKASGYQEKMIGGATRG